MTGYTKDHEWIAAAGAEATVGISHYAQDQLGDVVFVELPQVGKKLKKGDVAAVVESVKAASEVYSPVTGEVVAVNDTLTGDPALVNRSPEADGWFMRLRVTDPTELEGLMDEAAYKSFVDTI
ncbi:MAG: glycine cleavage system protein GcvH [Bauldia sp.]|jgi:glycine cleavage system H protein